MPISSDSTTTTDRATDTTGQAVEAANLKKT